MTKFKQKPKVAKAATSISYHIGASPSVVDHGKAKEWHEEFLAATSQYVEDAASETEPEVMQVNKKQRLKFCDVSYAASDTETMPGIVKKRVRNVRSSASRAIDFYSRQELKDTIAKMEAEKKTLMMEIARKEIELDVREDYISKREAALMKQIKKTKDEMMEKVEAKMEEAWMAYQHHMRTQGAAPTPFNVDASADLGGGGT